MLSINSLRFFPGQFSLILIFVVLSGTAGNTSPMYPLPELSMGEIMKPVRHPAPSAPAEKTPRAAPVQATRSISTVPEEKEAASPATGISPLLGFPRPEQNLQRQVASKERSRKGTDDPGGRYHIGVGDILTISVWQNPELTRQLAVLPGGDIHYPLIGKIRADGKTVQELSDIVTERLGPYVLNPVLTVTVDQARSMVVYVVGKVNNPGQFTINETVDALQAISLAGGVTAFAKADEILILREGADRSHAFPFDYDDVTRGKNTAQNIPLHRGDVIVVP